MISTFFTKALKLNEIFNNSMSSNGYKNIDYGFLCKHKYIQKMESYSTPQSDFHPTSTLDVPKVKVIYWSFPTVLLSYFV